MFFLVTVNFFGHNEVSLIGLFMIDFVTYDYDLRFKKPFVITHGVRTHTEAVFLKLSMIDEGRTISGWGEATLPPYLKENRTSVKNYIQKMFPSFEILSDENELINFINQLADSQDPSASKTILEMALLDLLGHLRQKTVREILNLPKNIPQKMCSYTICFSDSIHEDRSQILKLKEFKRLKFKFTSKNDLYKLNEVLDLLHNKDFTVDANQALTSAEDALELSKELYRRNCLALEQPLPIQMWDESTKLKVSSPIPILADESFYQGISLNQISKSFHGVNIKTLKMGGLIPSLKIIEDALKHNLLVQIGCMSESSLGCSYALSLIDHASFIDLDGPLLISNDPFKGLHYSSEGTFELTPNFGIGVESLI